MTKTGNAKTGSKQMLRQINKSLLLHLIDQHEPISRVELSRLTKLSPSTVSSLVDESLREGLVHETGISGTGVGRRMTMLGIKADGGYVLGIDLAHARCVLLDLRGSVVAARDLPRLVGKSAIAERLPAFVNGFLDEQRIDLPLLRRIGVSVPGRIDGAQRRIVSAIPLQLEDMPLGEQLEIIYGVPVRLVNDLEAAGFAERYNGVAQGYRTILYVLLDRTVGAGIVIDNQIYRGSDGRAGRTGSLYPYGAVDLSARLKTAHPDLFPAGAAPEETARRFAELGAAESGPLYEELERVLQGVADACGAMLQLLAPEQMIVNGWLADRPDVFERLCRLIARSERASKEPTPVRAARWGQQGAAIGAATLGLHEILRPVAVD
ncbi:ROK family transcriptional regulator [Cohnella nanjingensis]|uniref:ROK family transcriptional regulator n=1 Tax=Cohnella nanjingensis TaxID=1387779 RepID=A0A7X0VG45_9BACL|nr:ROK family transcriptional regulator [Cohnella nanjingensis]MBB6672727.1 ROK family transcriptional regulator [Cohnella nanjingensis]